MNKKIKNNRRILLGIGYADPVIDELGCRSIGLWVENSVDRIKLDLKRLPANKKIKLIAELV